MLSSNNLSEYKTFLKMCGVFQNFAPSTAPLSSERKTSVFLLEQNLRNVHLLPAECEGTRNAFPRDCADIQSMGKRASGVYTVYLNDPPRPTEVYCDLTTDGGRWLVCRHYFT